MQYWSENFKSWLPMEIWHVYQSSVKSDSHIQCLWTNWIYKFNPFPTSTSCFSWQVKDLRMECSWYPPKISWTRHLVINSDIDVLAVQESKLWKVDKLYLLKDMPQYQSRENSWFLYKQILSLGKCNHSRKQAVRFSLFI